MDLVIYDLDGTLIDSKTDLAHSVNATLHEFGRQPLAYDVIASYVGNGAPVLVRRALGPDATEAEADAALRFFLDYYREHKVDCTDLYPGVREVLDRLRDAGVTQAVLTNKPVRISGEILDALGVSGYFTRVYGGNSFEQKKPHPVGIETLIAECGVARDRVMMVGDSSVDIRTARNAGVQSCGVTYGFQPETLEADPPDILLDNLAALVPLVLP